MKYLYIYVNATECRFKFLITDVFIYIILQLIFYTNLIVRDLFPKKTVSSLLSRFILLDLSFKTDIDKKPNR